MNAVHSQINDKREKDIKEEYLIHSHDNDSKVLEINLIIEEVNYRYTLRLLTIVNTSYLFSSLSDI